MNGEMSIARNARGRRARQEPSFTCTPAVVLVAQRCAVGTAKDAALARLWRKWADLRTLRACSALSRSAADTSGDGQDAPEHAPERTA